MELSDRNPPDTNNAILKQVFAKFVRPGRKIATARWLPASPRRARTMDRMAGVHGYQELLRVS